MGNVASWSGTKNLNYLEYFDKAFADHFSQPFEAHLHYNISNIASGVTVTVGYLGENSGKKIVHSGLLPLQTSRLFVGHPNIRYSKRNDIFKIVIHRGLPIQANYENFQKQIRRITDQYEHFYTRFLRLYNKDKKLDFAVDLAKLDQKGIR